MFRWLCLNHWASDTKPFIPLDWLFNWFVASWWRPSFVSKSEPSGVPGVWVDTLSSHLCIKYVFLAQWDCILVTQSEVTRTSSPASIPLRETVEEGMVEMGPSHQELTSTKRTVLLIALAVLALKEQNSSSLTMCETQSCRELSGSSTSPSQLGIYPHSKEPWEIIIHNYIWTERKLGKGVNGPMKTAGSISASMVKKGNSDISDAWFVTCRYSWVRGLINKSGMEKFCTVVPCREFTF